MKKKILAAVMVVAALILLALPPSDATVTCLQENVCQSKKEGGKVNTVFGKVLFFCPFQLKFISFLAHPEEKVKTIECPGNCAAYTCYIDEIYYKSFGCVGDKNVCSNRTLAFEYECTNVNDHSCAKNQVNWVC